MQKNKNSTKRPTGAVKVAHAQRGSAKAARLREGQRQGNKPAGSVTAKGGIAGLLRSKERRLLFGGCAIVLVLLILVVVLSATGGASNELSGTWQLDQTTVYTFGEDGNGSLKMQDILYPFTYSAQEGILAIDFETDTVSDCKYTYTIGGSTLTLTGGEGTVGGTYTFTQQGS